uniref:Mitochondrial intermembrane space import and assembly protein 40 n=1 Tax=Tetraselmis sp. GSL018 TaxID=582737 RepID=A0A061RNF1_9CHLO
MATAFEKLAEDALRSGATGEELDQQIDDALSCPCVADLREGPCGEAFVAAFRCFIKSTEAEKGSDCGLPYQSLQACMLKNPEAFAEFMKPDEANEN